MARQIQEVTAIIFDKRGRILSIGKNSYTKTHTIQAKYAKQVGLSEKIFLHAEIDAIIKCRDIEKAYRMLVVRKLKSGKEANAKPCKICAEAIKNLTNIEVIDHT